MFALGVFLWRQNVFRRACFRVSWGKVVTLSWAFCMSEGKTLQGKISWIEVGVWDLNDFNTVFEIEFRIRETPHPLITQLIWVWQNPTTHILLTAHWAWQVEQVRLSGESKTRNRDNFRVTETLGCWWLRGRFFCTYSSFLKSGLFAIWDFYVICARVQTFFLSSVSPATHVDLQWRPKKLRAVSSPPVHLATQTGLPSHPLWSLKNTSGSEAPRGHASVCGPAHPGSLPHPAAIHLCVNCTSSHGASVSTDASLPHARAKRRLGLSKVGQLHSFIFSGE